MTSPTPHSPQNKIRHPLLSNYTGGALPCRAVRPLGTERPYRAVETGKPHGTERPSTRYGNETDYGKLDTERAYRAVAATIKLDTARYGGRLWT